MPPIPPWSEFGLHVVVKPIGPICNLRCRYCFYREKKSLYATDESWRMTDETLEAYIRQYIEAQPARTEEIEFTFQGGDPRWWASTSSGEPGTGAEIPAAGKRAKNSLQTNGVLLGHQWCGFFGKTGSSSACRSMGRGTARCLSDRSARAWGLRSRYGG